MADEAAGGRPGEALIDGTPITEEWCEHHFDHLSQDVIDNLYPVLDRMRSACPIAHSDVYGGYWVVTRYEEVLRIALDWETYSSAFGLTVPVAPIAVRNLPVKIDPPLQREFKRLVNPFFTPKAIWRSSMSPGWRTSRVLRRIRRLPWRGGACPSGSSTSWIGGGAENRRATSSTRS